jgi:hypothetical protein
MATIKVITERADTPRPSVIRSFSSKPTLPRPPRPKPTRKPKEK